MSLKLLCIEIFSNSGHISFISTAITATLRVRTLLGRVPPCFKGEFSKYHGSVARADVSGDQVRKIDSQSCMYSGGQKVALVKTAQIGSPVMTQNSGPSGTIAHSLIFACCLLNGTVTELGTRV